ncbi:alpha/beta hydrolase [Streptomyces sp. NPDC018057]|uniref:alpha/beta hydrolase n=1 Tax=unclassified Streptomyces TaxID=2593676 RepID=UPI00378E776C
MRHTDHTDTGQRPARRPAKAPEPGNGPQPGNGSRPGNGSGPGRAVEVPARQTRMNGFLALPPRAPAVVVLAHAGTGTARDPRYRQVAAALRRAGLGTLLLDLLTEDEGRSPHCVFDVTLLARRLRAATDWLRRETGLPVGYWATDTGAGAALEAAAADDGIRGVVSAGGRPELAGPAALARVRAPTLFVVGALDTRLVGPTRLAADWMGCAPCVDVVPDAGHLFAEPGALEHLAERSRAWFTAHLAAAAAPAAVPGGAPRLAAGQEDWQRGDGERDVRAEGAHGIG